MPFKKKKKGYHRYRSQKEKRERDWGRPKNWRDNGWESFEWFKTFSNFQRGWIQRKPTKAHIVNLLKTKDKDKNCWFQFSPVASHCLGHAWYPVLCLICKMLPGNKMLPISAHIERGLPPSRILCYLVLIASTFLWCLKIIFSIVLLFLSCCRYSFLFLKYTYL